jgi:hypothetical protein
LSLRFVWKWNRLTCVIYEDDDVMGYGLLIYGTVQFGMYEVVTNSLEENATYVFSVEVLEALIFSDMLVTVHQPTRCQNSEDHSLNFQYCVSMKSNI